MPDDSAIMPADAMHEGLTAPPISKRPTVQDWLRWFGIAMSFALIITIVVSLGDIDIRSLPAAIPQNPVFWMVFVAYYLAGPISEWVIYRHLWSIPPAGIPALLRKTVSNELLLGYLGEAQFYAWARSHGRIAAAPFGAIKDVTVLSALTGNIATLVILAMAWPIVHSGLLQPSARTIFLSLIVVLCTSFLVLLLRRRLFTLPPHALRFVTIIHSLRIIIVLMLTGMMWHLALPGIAISLWLVLAALRMLVSRLPLIPNKDIAFAGLAAILVGQNNAIGALLSVMAILILLAHILIGSVLAVADLLRSDS